MSRQIRCRPSATDKKQHVLLLNSYSKGYDWTDKVVMGVEDILRSHNNIVLKTEYMDTKVNNSDFYHLLLKALFTTKYNGKALDVIISSDDAPKFLKAFRDKPFPGVPVVFCS